MRKYILLTFMVAFVALGIVSPTHHSAYSEDETPTDQEMEVFPVTVDFESPRNFGFHVGDEIPLTITMKVKDGNILDLVNLPKEKESHGPFEVRGVKVKKRKKGDQMEYAVSYRLQSFEPAIAVDRLTFPPLRISYAANGNWNRKESKYEYQTLFSQAFDVLVSRTATYLGPMKDLKGPIYDRKGTLRWQVTMTLGGLMLLLALCTWFLDFIRKRRFFVAKKQILTSRDRALKALQTARENCFNHEDHRKHLFFEVNAILRDFLKEACDLDTANRPTMELVQLLKDHPYYDELNSLVARINQVVYEGDAPVDVEPIVRQFGELLENVDAASSPGVTHDQSG
jgi:hypothetical protein